MENVYIITTSNYSKILIFLFLKLYLKVFIRKSLKKGKNFYLFTLPYSEKIKNKKKYFNKLNEILKKKSIKNICCENNNEDFINFLKENFKIYYGEKIFFENINKFIEFFAKKKNIKNLEYKLCLISRNPEKVEKIILKCKNMVKSYEIYTPFHKSFEVLQDKLHSEYGIYLKIKEEEEKVKKFNNIYINVDNFKNYDKEIFSNVNLIDIYGIYKKSYSNIKINFKCEDDDFIKKEKIEKNINFAEFYFENCLKYDINEKLFDEKNIKIFNIKKYD